MRGGTVTIDSGEAPVTLDPAETLGVPVEQRVFMALYDTLTDLLPSSKEPQPGIASSWTVSADGLIYTFHIRAGVKFSNGEPLDGEDVIYTYQREEKLHGALGAVLDQIVKKMTLTAPMTVQVELTKRRPTFLGELAIAAYGIIPKRVAAHESEQQFAQHPVGTGPFMFKSATPGNSTVTMVRNPYYWRGNGQPYLDGLVFDSVENDNARVLAVRSGAATVAIGVPYSQVAALQGVPGVKMLIQPLWGVGLNPINDTKPPLNEVNVRRALMYATPFAAIVKSVYKGLATQANSVGGEIKFWDSHVPLYRYDLTKAKEMLKTTSVPSGFPVTIDCTGGETICELTASILQSSWAKIGVRVSIDTMDFSTLETDFGAGKYQIALLPPEGGVDEVWDPAAANFAYLSGVEFSSVAPSPHMKELIEKSFAESNESVRQKLAEEIQYDSYWKEPSWIPIVNLTSLNLVSDSLRGYSVMPSSHILMGQMWLAH